jgi:hypothetical protein
MYANGGGSRRKERKVSLLFREKAQDGKVRGCALKRAARGGGRRARARSRC